MSAKIIPFPRRRTSEFDCPICGITSACMFNVGHEHWFVCERDRAIWLIGSNLFSGWQYESAAQQRENIRRFASFRVVRV